MIGDSNDDLIPRRLHVEEGMRCSPVAGVEIEELQGGEYVPSQNRINGARESLRNLLSHARDHVWERITVPSLPAVPDR